jgi:hypothetical protein
MFAMGLFREHSPKELFIGSRPIANIASGEPGEPVHSRNGDLGR